MVNMAPIIRSVVSLKLWNQWCHWSCQISDVFELVKSVMSLKSQNCEIMLCVHIIIYFLYYIS